MTSIVSIWLALTLVLAAAMKARRPTQAAGAFATYGLVRPRAQRAVLVAVTALELALAGALAGGLSWAPPAAGVLFTAFAVLVAGALATGRGGRPCACFGSASRLTAASLARCVALAAAAAVVALGWLPAGPGGYERWLTLALSLTVAALAGLAVALLALAREVGVLRLHSAGRGALEIGDEGPRLGERQMWAGQIEAGPRALLRVAVFSSEGCPLCRRVAPAVEHLAADPLLAVAVLDELADASVWEQAAVPGSPYAVALDLDGVALAKGTFNALAQLESIVATARARQRGLAVAA